MCQNFEFFHRDAKSRLPARIALTRKDHCFSACSIVCTTFTLSGSSLLEKRATTFPERSTRNLLKFHEMPPANSGFVSLLVRNLYSGSILLPLTEIFANIGKVTLYFVEQNVLISSFDPGSCQRKLLAGKPITTRP